MTEWTYVVLLKRGIPVQKSNHKHFLTVFIYSLNHSWVNMIISCDLSHKARDNLLDCRPRNGLNLSSPIGTQCSAILSLTLTQSKGKMCTNKCFTSSLSSACSQCHHWSCFSVALELKTCVWLQLCPLRLSDLQHPATFPKAKCNTAYHETLWSLNLRTSIRTSKSSAMGQHYVCRTCCSLLALHLPNNTNM